MRRPYFLFLCSSAPYFGILLLAVSILLILLLKLFDVASSIDFGFSYLLSYVFEPFLISIVIMATFVSIIVYILFLFDLKKREDLDERTKRVWKKKFYCMFVLANSFYYDFKYGQAGKQFFLERFVKKSRDKIIKGS